MIFYRNLMFEINVILVSIVQSIEMVLDMFIFSVGMSFLCVAFT